MVELSSIAEILSDTKPRYNIAPSQNASIIRNKNDKLELNSVKWGLVPSWAKADRELQAQINARVETAHEKPMFKSAYQSKRCIIPSNGFYEWKKEGENKCPYFIKHKNNKLLLFAGILDSSYQGETFAILTCPANETMQPIHHRMPLILAPDDIKNWFNNQNLLNSTDNLLEIYRVSTLVNSPKNDSIACIDPI